MVSVTLTNVGNYSGEEVAQLYIRDGVSSTVRPLKELIGFQKVLLQPGESQRVSFTINKNTLGFYNADLKWVTEPRIFDVMAGAASNKLLLTEKVNYNLLK